MNDRLLREYVRGLLAEEYFLRSDSGKKKPGEKGAQSLFQKIKSFLQGHSKADALTAEWIDDAEMRYDFDIEPKVEDKIKDYVRKKFPVALQKSRGDVEKAQRTIRDVLNSVFYNYLQQKARDRRAEMKKELMDDPDLAAVARSFDPSRRRASRDRDFDDDI